MIEFSGMPYFSNGKSSFTIMEDSMISNNADLFVFGQNFMQPMNGSLTKMKGIPMTPGLFLEVQPTETILISKIFIIQIF